MKRSHFSGLPKGDSAKMALVRRFGPVVTTSTRADLEQFSESNDGIIRAIFGSREVQVTQAPSAEIMKKGDLGLAGSLNWSRAFKCDILKPTALASNRSEKIIKI
jgi:hypothetical protein